MPPRNWVEISRGALRRNQEYVRRRLAPSTALCAVVKADAYGHGAAACAEVFAHGGAEWLAVTSPEEGARLRVNGTSRVPVLVLAGFAPVDVAALLEHRLTPAVWDAEQIAWLAAGMAKCHPAGTPAGTLAVHLKVDTGMGRLGVTSAQETALREALERAPQIRVEAVFSHLAAAEVTSGEGNEAQHREFLAALERWSRWLPGLASRNGAGHHLLNGEGALRYPGWGGGMARVGLALYGYSAQPEHAAHLTPALSWKTHVIALKDLPAGHGVGYGPLYRAPRPMRVATIAAGYADGYRRQFSPGAHVLIGGVPAPVVGAISMDLTTIDVTDVTEVPGVRLGDEVTLLGGSGPARVTALELARLAGTIPYEILCGLSARVERIYRD